ncbi:MAG: MaoC family dehydratase N-terminal domain-containing protein [Ilumatobacteraceae bacterium]
MNQDEARSLVGTSERGTLRVTALDFQRWAAAIGDHNPLWFDPEHARSKGHPDVVMPPLFLSRGIGNVTRLDVLRPDGIPAGIDEQLPLPSRRMAGEDAWEFRSWAHAGDELEWERVLVGLDEKQGRSGTFVSILWETTFRNASDVVAINRQQLLAL